MPHTATPRRVAVWATRAFVASFTAQVGFVAGWAAGVGEGRPHLAVMVFGLLATMSIVAGSAAVLARCHLAIGQAFAAGLQMGSVARPRPTADRPRGLRAVE